MTGAVNLESSKIQAILEKRVEELAIEVNTALQEFQKEKLGKSFQIAAQFHMNAPRIDGDVDNLPTAFQGIARAMERVGSFKESAFEGAKVFMDAVEGNFLARETDDASHAVLEAFGNIAERKDRDQLVDFFVDSVRLNLDMQVDQEDGVVLVMEMPRHKAETIKSEHFMLKKAYVELNEIVKDFNDARQRIVDQVTEAINKAGGEPDELRKVADDFIDKSRVELDQAGKKVENRLTVLQAELEKAKVNAEIAGIEVEIAKKQLEIDKLQQHIDDRKIEKARMETDVRNMEANKARVELSMRQETREKIRADMEKTEFLKVVYNKRLSQHPGVPIMADGQIDVDALGVQLKGFFFSLEGQASTSVLSILDPTHPGEVVINDVLDDFSGVLKWMKILNLTTDPENKHIDDQIGVTQSSATDGSQFMVNSSSSKKAQGYNYIWYANKFVELYVDENVPRETLFREMLKWIEAIKKSYERMGQDNHNKIFATDVSSPNFQKGSYYETRYFIRFDKTPSGDLLDDAAARKNVERIDAVLNGNEELARFIDPFDAPKAPEEKKALIDTLQQERERFARLLSVDAAAKEKLPDGELHDWYYENINSDPIARDIIDKQLGAPVAKVLLWYRPFGGASNFPESEYRQGKSLNQVSFTPYVMTNWIEIRSALKSASLDRIENLRYVVVDPDGAWVTSATDDRSSVKETQALENQEVLSISAAYDKMTTNLFDNRAKKFKLRELYGLWKIYIYDPSHKRDPYFYGDLNENAYGTVVNSRLQNWEILLRYVRVSKI